MDVLVRFQHGLGDAVQLTCVLQHLAKHRPDWTVDVASHIGKHSAFRGQCRRSWILERDAIPERDYRQVFDLGWYECYSVYADSPCTKVCNSLREVFGIVPDRSLLKYCIDIGGQAREITGQYLSEICNVHSGLRDASTSGLWRGPNSALPYPIVAIHYEGNTSAEKKNLPHGQIGRLCQELRNQGYIPLILDWDRRSPLPDQKTIFCPGVGPGDVWDNTGTGDAERLAALIAQCALFIGVDSGPLHVAGATDTPTIGVWKGHSPIQFYDLCPNVTHLIPDRWRTVPPCQNDAAAKFFAEHYAYQTYRGSDDLESALIAAALETLAGATLAQPSVAPKSRPAPISIRAPPRDLASGNGKPRQANHISWVPFRANHNPTSPHKEMPMTTLTPAAMSWEFLPGLAREVALGADGSAFCLGVGEMPAGGYSIHRWNGADWDHIDGAAIKIAVGSDGSVWVVNREHGILRSMGVGWQPLPGLAREIACGVDGSAWCLSSGDFAPGGGSIHFWNGGDWNHVEGAAVKIAVGPDGLPWIVNSAGQIFRRSGEGWELMSGLASEIACGADGSVWCLSAAAAPTGDHSIHVWKGGDWEYIPGAAVKIAAGPAGSVLTVDAGNRIFRGR
ncbi:MAG: hypothetical protein HY290_22215 [Planctomycetia bacterium]|nr:hypothetical protein [Planctomycetia bacterium]